MDSGDYDKAFYNHLMTFNTETYDFTNNRPSTECYKSMKEMNIPIMAKFLEEVVDGHLDLNIKANDLFSRFNNFIKSNNSKAEYTSTKFGLELKNYEGVERIKKRDAYYYLIHIDKLKPFLISKYNFEFVDFIDDDDETALDI